MVEENVAHRQELTALACGEALQITRPEMHFKTLMGKRSLSLMEALALSFLSVTSCPYLERSNSSQISTSAPTWYVSQWAQHWD